MATIFEYISPGHSKAAFFLEDAVIVELGKPAVIRDPHLYSCETGAAAYYIEGQTIFDLEGKATLTLGDPYWPEDVWLAFCDGSPARYYFPFEDLRPGQVTPYTKYGSTATDQSLLIWKQGRKKTVGKGYLPRVNWSKALTPKPVRKSIYAKVRDFFRR